MCITYIDWNPVTAATAQHAKIISEKMNLKTHPLYSSATKNIKAKSQV